MTTNGEDPPKQAHSDPDFVMPRHDAIREDNWPEYEARGFRPVPEDLNLAQAIYGAAHIYTGDPFDYKAEHPLHHKPGTGIYVSPEGDAYAEEQWRQWRRWRREHPPAR